MARRAIIIGAGIAGLSAAIALRKAGWKVSLYEQAPSLEPMGAALSLWPNAMAALAWLGCDQPIRDAAQRLTCMSLADANGRIIAPVVVEHILPGASLHVPSRTALQSALLAGLGDIVPNLGKRMAGFSQDDEAVRVRFESGGEAKADLLVAADGIWSKIADQVLGTAPYHAGYGGILALSDAVAGHPSTGQGHEYWGNHERFGLIDVADDCKYWFYMRNEADPAESRALTKAMIGQRMTGWPSAIGAAIAATPATRLIPFSIHARPAPKRLGLGRIVCVGDAAHAMEPNLGQGGCQALEDAVALGIAARSADVTGIVPAYERMRLKRVRQIVMLSKQAGIVPHHMPHWLSQIARVGMRTFMPALGRATQREIYTLPDYV